MFRCATAALLGLILGYSSSVWSQNSDYVLEIADTLAVAEHPFDVPVLLSNTGGDIQGFSAGMCSDDAVLIPTGVIPGAALQGMNGGSNSSKTLRSCGVTRTRTVRSTSRIPSTS